MPLIQIKGVGGYLTLEQKQDMIRKVTDAVLSVEGEGLRNVTWVTIEDVQPGAWGGGGNPVTRRGPARPCAANGFRLSNSE